MIGVGKQETFQLWSASGLFYSLTYLVLFAIPLWGLRRSGEPALKLSGLIVLMYAIGAAMFIGYRRRQKAWSPGHGSRP